MLGVLPHNHNIIVVLLYNEKSKKEEDALWTMTVQLACLWSLSGLILMIQTFRNSKTFLDSELVENINQVKNQVDRTPVDTISQ